jgi:iron complex transport system substrate-binding protein
MAVAAAAVSGASPAATPRERIVSVAPNITELLYAAGAGPQVVAVSEFSDYPEAARSLPRIGDAFRLDYERIVSLSPTVVVVWETGTPAEVRRRLESLGLRVVGIPTRRLEDVAAGLEALGRVARTEDVAVAAARELRAGIAELRDRYRGRAKLRVFVEIDDPPLFTVGGPHLISEIIELCGGENVFADIAALAAPVGHESVLARRPDAILSTDDGDAVAEWSRFGGLPAVANGSVYRAPADLLSRPSPRIVRGAARVCELIEDARGRAARALRSRPRAARARGR